MANTFHPSVHKLFCYPSNNGWYFASSKNSRLYGLPPEWKMASLGSKLDAEWLDADADVDKALFRCGFLDAAAKSNCMFKLLIS